MDYNAIRKQRGIALITALLIVLVISILGVAVGQQVVALRKVSTSNYDYTLGINNAESALLEAGDTITSNFLSPDVIKGLSIDLITTANWWRNENKWASAAVVTGVSEGNPSFLIEDVGLDGSVMLDTKDPKRRLYRVTARATGKGEATAFLQAHYATME